MDEEEVEEEQDPMLNTARMLEITSQYTDHELDLALNTMFTAIKIRQNRRVVFKENATTNAVLNYFKSKPFITDVWCWHHYIPGVHTNDKYFPEMVELAFDYGEDYTGIQYITKWGRGEERTLHPRYMVKIERNSYNMCVVSLIPPTHHVISLPTTYLKSEEAVRNATIKCVIQDGIVGVLEGTDKRTRINIYGDLLKPFVKYFLTDMNAVKIINQASDVYTSYEYHHISKTDSATTAFLIIGRFRELGGFRVPYDIVKMIAKKVWKSRYQNDVWNFKIPENPKELDADGLWIKESHLDSEQDRYQDPSRLVSMPLLIQKMPEYGL
jgi:hypothetical protein